jgi:hypothetical protein
MYNSPVSVRLGALCDLYVKSNEHFPYNLTICSSPCSREFERSEKSRGHGDRPKTDCDSVSKDRHRAWFKPACVASARTAA